MPGLADYAAGKAALAGFVRGAAWDLAPPITDASFVPKVPAEYEGIAVLQRAAAVKNAAAQTAAPAAKK